VFAAALSVTAGLVVLLALARAMLLGVVARRHAGRARPALVLPAPAVSVVVPAFNEAAVIAATVRSLAASDYPSPLEIVVVDDGSTDQTAAVVEGLGLAGVRVLRQDNTGKAGALNAAIASARHDIIVSADADTVFERETVVLLVAALAAPGVGAVAGNTKVANRARRLGRWQHIEYVIGFNLDRRLYDVLSCMPTVPGAVGAFRRRALEDVGLSQARRSPKTRTSPSRSTGLAGASRMTRGPSLIPRRPGLCAACGASASAGRTERCSRCASTGPHCAAIIVATSAAAVCHIS
jgi:cellulose synthase/poly-beta-1,6-N-acetylglucosamine synthase-like glycosyltransferase